MPGISATDGPHTTKYIFKLISSLTLKCLVRVLKIPYQRATSAAEVARLNLLGGGCVSWQQASTRRDEAEIE